MKLPIQKSELETLIKGIDSLESTLRNNPDTELADDIKDTLEALLSSVDDLLAVVEPFL